MGRLQFWDSQALQGTQTAKPLVYSHNLTITSNIMAVLLPYSEDNLHSLALKSMGVLTSAPLFQVHPMILLVVFLNGVLPVT